jgi:hypothetical protein
MDEPRKKEPPITVPRAIIVSPQTDMPFVVSFIKTLLK